ncbi:N-acyl amino acid synthase FeeM domain-containing protein [Desulfobacter postgatei]|uniref:N-acyl amino acid synthase FeeM domain-containing protein n=1 Tax=Desulfobacter postgatei TaxID=2293 RepID=UPI003C6C3B41
MKISNALSTTLLPCPPGPPVYLKKRSFHDELPDLQTKLDGVTFREASSIQDYISCFSLLHDVYVEAGFIQPSRIPLRIIPHHSDPEARVFMGCPIDTQAEKRPIYTVSLFPDNEQGLPMDIGFKREVDVLRNQGRRLVEVGCLASHPEFRKGDKKIPMLGNRMVVSYAVNTLHADDLLITVHPKYLKIYEDILLFEKIGQISSYSYVNDNPAVALRQNLKTWPQKLKKVYGKNPIEKNLYHFLFESEPTSTDPQLAKEDRADNKNFVIKVITGEFLTDLCQIGCPTHENICNYFMNFREKLSAAG